MEKRNVMCLHQWIKPPTETKIKVDGVGDCQTCTANENNKYCRNYCEITKPNNFLVRKG